MKFCFVTRIEGTIKTVTADTYIVTLLGTGLWLRDVKVKCLHICYCEERHIWSSEMLVDIKNIL